MFIHASRHKLAFDKFTKMALTAATLTLAVAAHARAQIYAADSFSYAAGAGINGQNGGTGFSTAYSGDAATVTAGSLGFGNLKTAGNSTGLFSGFGQSRRSLNPFSQPDGTTAYLSFLVRPNTTNSLAGIEFGDQGTTELFIGATNGNYTVEGLFNSSSSSSAGPVTAGATAFLVLRIDFRQGNDAFSLYLNPTPGGTEPLVASATKTDVDLFANANFYGLIGTDTASQVDEFRLGATYADVTAVPEPSTYFATLCGLSLLMAAHRLRRGVRA